MGKFGVYIGGFLFLVGLAALAWHLYGVVVLFQEQRILHRAHEDIKKLAVMARSVYGERAPQSGEVFWRDIGRTEPIRDPWGMAYQLEVANAVNQKQFFWRSAGPDKQFRTSDDLIEVFEFDFDRPDAVPFPAVEAK